MQPKHIERLKKEKRRGQLKSAAVVGLLALYILMRYASSFGNYHNWSSKATESTAPQINSNIGGFKR